MLTQIKRNFHLLGLLNLEDKYSVKIQVEHLVTDTAFVAVR
jgi:hypothetical protein